MIALDTNVLIRVLVAELTHSRRLLIGAEARGARTIFTFDRAPARQQGFSIPG